MFGEDRLSDLVESPWSRDFSMSLVKGALLSPHLGTEFTHRLPLLGSWEVRDALLMHQHLLISSCQLSSEALSTTDCEVALAV